MRKSSEVRKALCYAALMEDNGVFCTIGDKNYVVKRRKEHDQSKDVKPFIFYQEISPRAKIEIDYAQFERQVAKYAKDWLDTPYVKAGDKYLEVSTRGLNEIEVSDIVRKAAGHRVPNVLIKTEQEDNEAHEMFLARQADREALLQSRVEEKGLNTGNTTAANLEL